MTLSSMKPFASSARSCSACLFLAAATLSAQQPAGRQSFGVSGVSNSAQPVAQPTDQVMVLNVEPAGHGCPVSMEAKQAGLGDMIKVRNFTSSAPDAMQQIRLTLQHDGDSRKIVSARVAVRGTAAKGRTIAALSTNSENADKSTTIDVRFASLADAESARLVLEGFTSVTSITLKALTYSDGFTWTPSEGATCRTVPDPLVLVGLP